MQVTRLGVLGLLIAAFVGTTAVMLMVWLQPDIWAGLAAYWTQLLAAHAVSGQALVGFVAVLAGWRLGRRWLERLGWAVLTVQLVAVLGVIAITGLTEMSLLDLHRLPSLPWGPGPDRQADLVLQAILITAPRLLFLLTLLVWGRSMVAHALLFSAALGVVFIGLLLWALVMSFNANSNILNEGTDPHAALDHIVLFIPLLLAFPAFLVPLGAPARLMPTAWTGSAAMCFLVAAGLYLAMGPRMSPSDLADNADKVGLAREFAIASLAALALWLAALVAHRR